MVLELLGEDTLLLNCNHLCHKLCMLMVLTLTERDVSLPDYLDPSVTCCNKCGAPAQCHDSLELSQVLEDIAIQGIMLPVETKAPFTPQNQKIPDPIMHPPAPMRPHSDIASCNSSEFPTVDCAQVNNPRITIESDTRAIAVETTHLQEVAISMHIQAPPLHSVVNPMDELQKQVLIEEVLLKLARLENYNKVAFGLNQLLIFDFLNISVSGSEWDTLCCLLFDDRLLLVDFSKSMVVGQLLVQNDISNVNKRDDGVTLNLTQEDFPELQMCHSHPLICLKWNTFLSQMVALRGQSSVPRIPLNQLTTNGWYVIEENFSLVPENALRVRTATEHDGPLSESLVLESLPQPELLPVNLVLAIPLCNNSTLEKKVFQEMIIQLIANVRAGLRHMDKLGLIFIGTDSSGRFCRKGSFVGCAEVTWDGWDSILQNLEVSSNYAGETPIFDNELQELQIAFEKCRDLFPFIPSSPSNINRLLVVQPNQYRGESWCPDTLESFSRSLSTILDIPTISVDFLVVGEPSMGMQLVHDLVRSPFQGHMLDSLQIRSGTMIQTYPTIQAMVDTAADFVSLRYRSVCIPTLTLELQKVFATSKLVWFQSIEINGAHCDVHSEVTHMRVMLDNISTTKDYTVTIHAVVDMVSLDPNVCESVSANLKMAGLFAYNTAWRGQHSHTTTYDVEILLTSGFSFLEDAKSILSANDRMVLNNQLFHDNSPLLPAAPLTMDLGFLKQV